MSRPTKRATKFLVWRSYGTYGPRKFSSPYFTYGLAFGLVAYMWYRAMNIFVSHFCMVPRFLVFVALTMCMTSKVFVVYPFLGPQLSFHGPVYIEDHEMIYHPLCSGPQFAVSWPRCSLEHCFHSFRCWVVSYDPMYDFLGCSIHHNLNYTNMSNKASIYINKIHVL